MIFAFDERLFVLGVFVLGVFDQFAAFFERQTQPFGHFLAAYISQIVEPLFVFA